MLANYTGSCVEAPVHERFGLEDFDRAGLRVIVRRFQSRDTIFAPGDSDDQLYFLLEGAVRLYRIYGDYKEATTALLGEGSVFGKLSLSNDGLQEVFAEAMTQDVRVAAVRKASLADVVKRDPQFALKLFASFSERLRQSDEVIEGLLHRGVSMRLATLLLHLSDRFGKAGASGTLITVRLTHQDLANMVASTREAVSKVMSELQREGTIRIHKRRIITQPRLLELYRERSVATWPVMNTGAASSILNASPA